MQIDGVSVAEPTHAARSLSPPNDDQTIPKSVGFIPLSPKSSQTLRQHHREIAHKDHDSDSDSSLDHPTPDSETWSQLVPTSAAASAPSRPRSRRLSDPSHNRPYTPDSDGDVVELLPDRFDSQGRPLDRPPVSRTYSRQGDFVYRFPWPEPGWNVSGRWGVMGADDRQVEKIARKVTDAIEGRGSVLGLLGGILNGSLLEGEGERESGDEGRERKSRRRLRDRERGEREEGEGYDYDDDRDERRRRRRMGSR